MVWQDFLKVRLRFIYHREDRKAFVRLYLEKALNDRVRSLDSHLIWSKLTLDGE